MLPELLELHQPVLLIPAQLVELRGEVAEEGALLGLGVRVLQGGADVLESHAVVAVVVEPVEYESQHCLAVHEAEGRNAREVLLEEEPAGGAFGDQSKQSLEVGQFCEVRGAVVEGLRDIVEGEVGFRPALEGAEALVESMNFLLLQAKLRANLLQLLALEGTAIFLLRRNLKEPHQRIQD